MAQEFDVLVCLDELACQHFDLPLELFYLLRLRIVVFDGLIRNHSCFPSVEQSAVVFREVDIRRMQTRHHATVGVSANALL